VDYLYRLMWSGKLEAEKVNERWRVPLAAIEARLREREQRESLNG
jgi:hypothetical protein